MRNLPDGTRESDIPGYWDTECPRCEDEGYTDDCPDCGGVGIVDMRERDSRSREEAAISAYADRFT